MFAEDEARLLMAAAAESAADLDAMVERRAGGLPLEVVIGWAEFCDLRIEVDPGVFVPRHRTQLLVAEAAARGAPGMVVVDLCCGSGAIAVALAAAVGRVELHATDVDAAAVRCARRNLAAAAGRVYQGDLYEPLPASLRGRVDIVVSSPPYVPTAAIESLPREARQHEPRVALDGGGDGLDVVRRIVAPALLWLAPGGHLLVETSEDQAAPAAGIVERGGLVARVARLEELDATVVIGRSGAG